MDDGRGADPVYAVVTGLYTGLLLAPALVLALSTVVTGAGGRYVAFLGAVAVVGLVVGLAVSRRPRVAVTLGGTDGVWGLVALPVAWLALPLAATAAGATLPDVAVPLVLVGATGGLLAGLVVVTTSRTRHADALLADADEDVVWEARWPRRWRLAGVTLAGAAIAVAAGGFLAEYAFGVDDAGRFYGLLYLAIPAGALAFDPRTVRVTSAGLSVERPLQRHCRPWAAVAGYELTDDALTIHYAAPWRPALRCDRNDVAGDAADGEGADGTVGEVVAALDRRRCGRADGAPAG